MCYNVTTSEATVMVRRRHRRPAATVGFSEQFTLLWESNHD